MQVSEPHIIAFQFNTKHISKGLPGEIIFGGTDAAGDNQHIAFSGVESNRIFDRFLIIGHSRMADDVATYRRQLLAEPGGVCIDCLAQNQFVANREND